MAVSTSEARAAATSTAQKGLQEIYDQLSSLGDDRKAKLKLVQELGEINSEASTFLVLTERREKQHSELVNKILNEKIDEFSWVERKPHDWSKDKLFLFVCACYFDGGLQTPEMKVSVDEELARHRSLESHHPEYENYNEAECSPQDVLEMAVDRLARNAQFGDGIIRVESVKKFTPEFPKGNNEEKQALFLNYVVKYEKLVQKEFYDMFPEAKSWGDSAEASSISADKHDKLKNKKRSKVSKKKCSIM